MFDVQTSAASRRLEELGRSLRDCQFAPGTLAFRALAPPKVLAFVKTELSPLLMAPVDDVFIVVLFMSLTCATGDSQHVMGRQASWADNRSRPPQTHWHKQHMPLSAR